MGEDGVRLIVMKHLLAAVLFVGLIGLYDWAIAQEPAEPEVDASELPRIPPTAPEDALATLELRPGFAAKLAAHEPQVVDPVAACFDEDGAMFAVEMRGGRAQATNLKTSSPVANRKVRGCAAHFKLANCATDSDSFPEISLIRSGSFINPPPYRSQAST